MKHSWQHSYISMFYTMIYKPNELGQTDLAFSLYRSISRMITSLYM